MASLDSTMTALNKGDDEKRAPSEPLTIPQGSIISPSKPSDETAEKAVIELDNPPAKVGPDRNFDRCLPVGQELQSPGRDFDKCLSAGDLVKEVVASLH